MELYVFMALFIISFIYIMVFLAVFICFSGRCRALYWSVDGSGTTEDFLGILSSVSVGSVARGIVSVDGIVSVGGAFVVGAAADGIILRTGVKVGSDFFWSFFLDELFPKEVRLNNMRLQKKGKIKGSIREIIM